MLRNFREIKWRGCFSCLLFFTILAAGCKKKTPPAAPPEVQVITVTPTNVPIYEEWIGTLDGLVNAQIHAQVSGYLQTQRYAEGSRVKKGDLLFEIDPRPFQATLDQVQARITQDQANLAKTDLDVKRYTPLAKEQAISQETLDNATQANLAAKAQVKADEAALESAKLNIEFTRITSPVDGLAGIALAQIGDLVGPASPVLTTVSALDPIKVYFQVNEQSYLNFWRKFTTSGDTNQESNLNLILSDGSTYPQKGKYYSSDRQMNINTGTLQIVAIFPNEDYALRPGQYGRVRALTDTKTNVFLIPQRAITEMQGAYQVAIVTNENNTNKTHVHPVKVGVQIGSDWLVESGLQPGEQLVVEGLQKAKEGAVVTPKPRGTPESNAATNHAASTNSAH